MYVRHPACGPGQPFFFPCGHTIPIPRDWLSTFRWYMYFSYKRRIMVKICRKTVKGLNLRVFEVIIKVINNDTMCLILIKDEEIPYNTKNIPTYNIRSGNRCFEYMTKTLK